MPTEWRAALAPNHETIDGVPVFWVDQPGSLTACLLFRVGQADETLPTRGRTHLIEHLALAAMGREHGQFNGCVDHTTTSFVFNGDEGEITRALNGVVGALADLPYGRIETERKILRTEAAGKSPGVWSEMASLRFGPHGYGLAAYGELGLHRLDPGAVEAWRRQWFHTGNAALWLSGPPPAGLDLSALPTGMGPAPVPVPAVVNGPYPAWYGTGMNNGVAFSVLHDRSLAWSCAAGILNERLTRRLRTNEGVSYSVGSSRERWGRALGQEMFIADALPDTTARVRDVMVAEAAAIAATGPDAQELHDVVTQARRSFTEPDQPVAIAAQAAFQHLVGAPVQPVDEAVAELEALTPAAVAGAARQAMGTALWLLPRSLEMLDRGTRRVPDLSPTAVAGHRFARPARARRPAESLVVGPEGISHIVGPGEQLTITSDGCRAVQRHPDGLRLLFGHDALVLRIHPDEWDRGAEVIAAIDAFTPTPVVVVNDEPSQGPIDLTPDPSSPRVGRPVPPAWFAAVALAVLIAFVVVMGALWGTRDWAEDGPLSESAPTVAAAQGNGFTLAELTTMCAFHGADTSEAGDTIRFTGGFVENRFYYACHRTSADGVTRRTIVLTTEGKVAPEQIAKRGGAWPGMGMITSGGAIVFVGILLVILLGLHFRYWSVARPGAPEPTRWWQTATTNTILGIACLLPLTLVLPRGESRARRIRLLYMWGGGLQWVLAVIFLIAALGSGDSLALIASGFVLGAAAVAHIAGRVLLVPPGFDAPDVAPVRRRPAPAGPVGPAAAYPVPGAVTPFQ